MLKEDLMKDSVAEKVAEALSGPEAEWRTLGGIARESGLPVIKVSEYIRQHPEDFRQSSVKPGGLPLYRIRRKPGQAVAG